MANCPLPFINLRHVLLWAIGSLSTVLWDAIQIRYIRIPYGVSGYHLQAHTMYPDKFITVQRIKIRCNNHYNV